jgi:hypothetical protein
VLQVPLTRIDRCGVVKVLQYNPVSLAQTVSSFPFKNPQVHICWFGVFPFVCTHVGGFAHALVVVDPDVLEVQNVPVAAVQIVWSNVLRTFTSG